MNHFDADLRQAHDYHRHRPRMHAEAVRRLCTLTGISSVTTALDVGCGTGLGSHALLACAEHVIGCDPSPAMLAACEPDARITWLHGPAEAIPWSSPVDLITCFLAYHWFDQEAFLAEARRLLAPGGYLAVINHGMTGVVQGHPAFTTWYQDYLRRYPTPARKRPGPEQPGSGFGPLRSEAWDEGWQTDRDGIAAYLMTQSNALAACAGGAEPTRLHAAVRDALSAVLPAGPLTLTMAGRMWVAPAIC